MAESATNDSPQIVISYHVDDEKWKDRFVVQLAGVVDKYGIWIDRVDAESRRQVDKKTVAALENAKVLILLVSPSYLNSAWIADKQGYGFLAGKDSNVLGLLVQNSTKEELSTLPSFYIPMNATPLEETTIETSQVILAKTARLVKVFVEEESDSEEDQGLFTIADLSRFEQSFEVHNALTRARILATYADIQPPIVTTSCLLFGLAESGRERVPSFKTPQFLWREMTRHGEDAYERAFKDKFPRKQYPSGGRAPAIDFTTEAELITPNVVKVLEFADKILRQTIPRSSRLTSKTDDADYGDTPQLQIGARHLLAALLVFKPGGDPLGVDLRLGRLFNFTLLRKRFYEFIVESLPDDNHESWRTILIDLKLPESEAASESKAEPQPPDSFPQPSVAGFMADDWTGRDLLGITSDVNALASLVAAYKVEPPLSIGLFGDWGSGKSHFMRQMRKRVETLSQLARESRRPQKELGYYKNIVQIEFNAWHYIEGNLWASLVDHIFANLKLSEREDPSYAEQRRDELMQKLGVKEEIQRKIDSKVQERESELDKLKERKQEAEAERVEALVQLNGFRDEAKTSLEKLSVPINVSEAEKNLLSAIGITIGAEISAADMRKSYLATKGTWNRWRAQWQLFRTDKRVARRYVLAALLVIIAAGGPLLIQFAKFPRLQTALASVLAFIGTFYVAAKPIWTQFQQGLKALEKHDAEIERERQQRMTELESKIRLLETEVLDAKLEGKTVGKEIEKLKADITATTSSKILAEFIEDRAAASDYRRHLGLVALIRRDFEKLRELFDQQRQEEIDGKERPDDKRINRIVLYIDDLDRCPPGRVVQVLQAIHLLLAFPIFVVIVGVDSRWITRSLQQSYEWLREVDEDEETQRPEARDTNRRNGAGATPHDYLEKIFQIPFWLRSMNEDTCKDLLDGLTANREETSTGQNGEGASEKVPVKEQSSVLAIANAPPRANGLATTTQEQSIVYDKPSDIPTTTIKRDIPQTIPGVADVTVNAQREPAKESDDIELSPRSLTFSNYEIDYMKKLVPLIGRSPRAVKRFLNCYRLIKVGLTPSEFETFVGEKGESQSYKAAMILLGVITGTPAVSSYVIDELKLWRAAKEFELKTFTQALTSNAEMQKQPDADRLNRFFQTHDFGASANALFKEVVNYGPRVSRFSFRVDLADASRKRRNEFLLDQSMRAELSS